MIAMVLALALMLQAAPAGPRGVATGRIQTPDGYPVVAIRVAAIPAPRPGILPSDGQNYYATQAPASTALTNSQGQYRLTNVPPGRYYIVTGAVQPTFYPGTTNIAEATIVTVEDGTLPGLDFRLLSPFGGRVSGRVTPPPAAGVREIAVLSGLELGELLETPVRPDGTFDFGQLPRGPYLVSLFPTVPSMPSTPFRVEDGPVTGLELVKPALRTVSGRIVVKNGPLPTGLLGFSTVRSWVPATIAADGSFTARLQPDRHQAEISGMPIGYSLASVQVDGKDVPLNAIAIGDRDLTGVVVTIAPPGRLPRLRGTVSAPGGRKEEALSVELTGPIVGAVRAPVRPDGSFEVAALTPGRYTARVPQVPDIAPVSVVVTGEAASVELRPAAR